MSARGSGRKRPFTPAEMALHDQYKIVRETYCPMQCNRACGQCWVEHGPRAVNGLSRCLGCNADVYSATLAGAAG